jgi:hypothetical protein
VTLAIGQGSLHRAGVALAVVAAFGFSFKAILVKLAYPYGRGCRHAAGAAHGFRAAGISLDRLYIVAQRAGAEFARLARSHGAGRPRLLRRQHPPTFSASSTFRPASND